MIKELRHIKNLTTPNVIDHICKNCANRMYGIVFKDQLNFHCKNTEDKIDLTYSCKDHKLKP